MPTSPHSTLREYRLKSKKPLIINGFSIFCWRRGRDSKQRSPMPLLGDRKMLAICWHFYRRSAVDLVGRMSVCACPHDVHAELMFGGGRKKGNQGNLFLKRP
jgi:hypothetical protein